MQLRYIVDVTVDPTGIGGRPSSVVGDEIQSNLESVEYVLSCDVQPSPRSTAMNATAETAQPTESRKGKAYRLPHQGNINATVFQNHGQNGVFYTADIQRSYLEGEGENAVRRYTHSLKPSDMPDVIKQAEAVQQKIAELTQAQGHSR